jgi:hypothetical protein
MKVPKPEDTRALFRKKAGKYSICYNSKPVLLDNGILGLKFTYNGHCPFVIKETKDNMNDTLTLTIHMISNLRFSFSDMLMSKNYFQRGLELSSVLSIDVQENLSLCIEE